MTENEDQKILNLNLKDDDKIFNELKELQKLIKKESAIKELFIKTKNETKKSISDKCVDIYKKKMEVLNTLQKIKNIKSNASRESSNLLKDYTLVQDNYNYLQDLNSFISEFLKYLWEEPKILANLLIKANKEETKKYLAPLICNNFYENILSPNNIQDPLIYIIYLLLKNEIDNFKDINEGTKNFLNDTPCSYLLQQLLEKNDIKEFFKLVLKDALEDLGDDKFIFNIEKLNEWQLELGKKISTSIFDKNYLNSKNVDNRGIRFNAHKKPKEKADLRNTQLLTKVEIQGLTEADKEIIKNNINYQVFTATYLTYIPVSEIKRNINKYKDDICLKNYYEYLLSNTKGDYSQNSFFDNILKLKNSESLLVFYQEHFLKAKEFINKILENIISNYRIIPYAIKCVAKIIVQLINNKFPDANEIQKNLFINKFLYQTLLFPVFEKPDINALINDYIISNNVLYNLRIIRIIISILGSFRLFKDDDPLEGDLTPFNRVFLEKIPDIFKINKYIVNIDLPHFIDGLIKKTINEDEYYFDFFNENPNEIFFYKSILLNIKEFYSLFKNILAFKGELLKSNFTNNNTSIYIKFRDKSEKNIKSISILLDKLTYSSNYKVLSDLVNEVDNSIKISRAKSDAPISRTNIYGEKIKKVEYFHVSYLLFNEKPKKIFELEQKNNYYHIEELKEKNFNNLNLKDLQMKNNIIKCKNFFSSILYNIRNLEKINFNKGTTKNIIDILKELTYFMKSSNYLIDGKIPSEWYLVSLMECLKKLPNDYKVNEYKKLFEELTTELNESIKQCDFYYISLLLEGIKFGDRNKNFQEKVKEIYIDIELNNKANNVIENGIISLDLNLKSPTKNSFTDFINLNKDKANSFITIEKYIKTFPNLNDYKFCQENSGEKINIFELQKKMDVPTKLNNFFKFIALYLKDQVKNENELRIINDKIFDYVMSRLNDKIYPKVRNKIDIEIFKNACKLNWIEPENVFKDKDNVDYDFDFVLPEINKYFNLIREEKSPRKKLINLNNIIESINKLLRFTKGDIHIGLDDQMPLIIYCFIKCKPWGIFTDCNFMELYIGNKKNKMEDSQLNQLKGCCYFIKDTTYTSFNNISEAEYIEKGQISLKELSEYMIQFNVE